MSELSLRQQVMAYIRLMRLNRPIGIYLLLWPNLWALWIASEGRPQFSILLIFITGVVVMRSAGCIINDFADRHIDGHVQRTQSRPLARGEIKPRHALLLFFSLCLVGFILVLMLNGLTVLIAGISLALSSLYPYCKRFTHLPQVMLGIAWYLGVLMAFAAETGRVPAIAWLVYFTVVLWTIVYDTMYGLADRADDLKIGVKSTAVLFAQYDKLFIGVLQVIVLGLLVSLGLILHYTVAYYGSVAVAMALFIYQQYLIKDREPSRCVHAFLNNNWLGLAIFLGIVSQYDNVLTMAG